VSGLPRDVGDGFELDDDPGRIDLNVGWRYLSPWSYRGRGRSRAFVAESIERSHRVVSDGLTAADLCDGSGLPAFQGRGPGRALVREAFDGGDLDGVRWIPRTGDAHDLHRESGFAEPGRRAPERGAPRGTGVA
jgi:hypothetical protein